MLRHRNRFRLCSFTVSGGVFYGCSLGVSTQHIYLSECLRIGYNTVFICTPHTTMSQLPQLVCIKDFERYAEDRLDRNTLDYYQSGANDEETLHDNVKAFSRYRLRPRILRDVSSVDLSTTVLGEKVTVPILVAPTAMHCLAHPQGERATVKATEEVGTCYVMSNSSTSSVSEISSCSPASLKWYQLYVYKDRRLTLQLVKTAEDNGFKALVLTVDAQVWGKMHADRRQPFVLPPHLRLKALEDGPSGQDTAVSAGLGHTSMTDYMSDLYDPSLTWRDVTWLKQNSKLPLILKGILTAEDAVLAVEHGADGIIVSNHGGRLLDGVPASIDMLQKVVGAVAGRCEVYIDSGVRTGIDVFRCLALGARAVLIGRPVLWGLAYNGKDGVSQVLNILRDELKIAMSLTGARNIAEISADHVVHESHYLGQQNFKSQL